MKYDFAGPQWVAFMHGLISEKVAALGDQAKGLDWSFCEVFTDPPAVLSPNGRPLAWGYVVRGANVEFFDEDLPEAAVRIVADYDSVLPLARYDSQGDEARSQELAAMSQSLMESGKLVVHGDRSQQDGRIANLHDPIARVTK